MTNTSFPLWSGGFINFCFFYGPGFGKLRLSPDTRAARAISTNYVNTASTPVNTASTTANTASTPVNTASPSRNIPSLEDIYEVPNDGIFASASYDDEGAVADFINLESTVNVNPIPQSKIHSIDPTTQILGDLNIAVQTRSKANKKEEIDYDEVFAHVARIEAIRIFLAFAFYMGFIVYQMDVKSAFLYGKIDEEVYVSQPPGFIDPKFPKKVYKVIKALYGLHQAPRAWYATLSTFLVQSRYRKGLLDKTLFIKKDKKDIMLVQVKQKEDGIFISHDKYVAEILKKIDFMSMKTVSIPIKTKKTLVKDAEAADRIFRFLKGQLKLGLWYPRESVFDLEAYLDSDYAGANLNKKSTTRGCQFLEEDFDALLDERSEILYSIEGTPLKDKIFAKFDEFIAMNFKENVECELDEEEPTFKKITFDIVYKIKTSLEEPPTDLQLVGIKSHLNDVGVTAIHA
nr:hypothetical protein [Tanacetum cinerariifolium]